MSAISILAEECELLNDSKYRSYITQIEKALRSFDSTSEWADLISALGKLNKVLLAHVKYPVVPKRVTIGKRLAQCLHPALPSGVHMKALETYDIIFKCIGTERLAQDLFIYTAGLFPLLGYAAMNVKPILLMVYERHFVSLGKRIKPGLNGLLLGLLPGLEEGSEGYDQTNGLLEDFCECTSPAYFYTCLWECVHSCPSVRLSAITYLLTHFNKKQSMEDQLHMIGLNINLMIEGICHALQDNSVLVQRSILDFLLLAFPQHNSQLTHSDMAKVVKAAINVLLRRDMSLNRRFYSMLLGTSATAAHAQLLETIPKGDKSGIEMSAELSYFQKYSKDFLVQALKCKLNEKPDQATGVYQKSAILKPFRMLLSLLDKPEIGPVILENVLLAIFRCLYREFENSKTIDELNLSERRNKPSSVNDKGSAYEELIKTANLLFGTFEPYFIWDYAARMYEQTCMNAGRKKSVHRQDSTISRQGSLHEMSDNVSIAELCQLVSFLLDIVSLETFSETQTEHLPSLLCSMITCLTQHCASLSDNDIITTLQLGTRILSKVQPTMTVTGSHDMSCDLETSHDPSHDTVEGVEVTTVKDKKKHPGPSIPILSVEEALEMNKKLKAEQEQSKNENKSISENSDNLSEETKRNQSARQSSSTEQKESLSRKHSTENQSTNLMQKCIDCFQNFFTTLVTQKIFRDAKMAEKCFETILLNRSESEQTNMMDKDSFLDSDSEFSFDDRLDEDGRVTGSSCKISVKDVEDISLKTFSTACQLMVEFASFPMYCQDSRSRENNRETDQTSLPCWIQDLVTCCCCVDSFHVQSSAISTMLDLIILTQSVQVDGRSAMSHDTSAADGPKSVQILPTLHHNDLKYLAEQTNFFKISASILWQYLGETTPQYHQLTVKLFHILHQVAPSSWVCENVIGNQLVQESQKIKIAAYKKFTILWHLTRNKKTGVIPGKPLRTFDRSMFVILDSLREETSAVKEIATTWLTHVIQHGDISRIMEPLLLMLLHPDTARVSIQHVNIHKAKKVKISESSEDNSEANVYAISSEGGNIIYHVSSAKEGPKKFATEDLKSYALTVLSEKGTTKEPMRTRSEQELHYEKVDPNNLKLRINPFGSESSLDNLIFSGFEFPSNYQDHYNKAKRLDRETCKAEGISFVDGESTPGEETEDEQKGNHSGDTASCKSYSSASESVGHSTEDLVKSLIDEMLTLVVNDDNDNNSTKPNQNASQNANLAVPRKVSDTARRALIRSESITSSNAGDHDLLNSVRHGSGIDSPTPSEKDVSMFQDVTKMDDKESTDIHTLHMHMLLYSQKYDYERTLYALTTLKSMLVTCPRLMVTSLVTSSISSLRAPQMAKLQLLLARHRKSVFGKNFFGEIPAEVMSNYRSSMFIEILISVCLYFIRGYYPNLMISKLSPDELLGNKQVHILATEMLTLMTSEIICIMRDSGKSFVSYISDLLQRCKVQKALLHCILAVIYNNRKKKAQETVNFKITEAIIVFNEESLEPSANETFQIKLLNFLLAMIMLEDQIYKCKGVTESPHGMEWDRLRVSYQPSLNNVRYNLGHPIVQQGMFVSGVLSALKQFHMCHMHRHWVGLITSSLPYMGKYLPGIIMTVVSQLCRNIEALAVEYETEGTKSHSGLEKIPPDHVVNMLDGVMTLCHYCLLDNVSPVSIGQTGHSSTIATPATMATTSLLTNLFHVFNPVGGGRESSPQRDSGLLSPVLDARTNILSVLPRIIACMASLWRAITILERHDESPKLTMGAPKVVKQYILEFLSPISLPHGSHLLGAIAVAWNDRRKKQSAKSHKKVVVAPGEDQLLLVDLVSAIKVLPMDTLIQTVKQVIKQPPSSELSRTKKGVPLEVNMLQFFYAYVQKTSANQLVDSWSALLALLKDGLTLNPIPPGQFLLVLILNEFVQKTPSMVDKKHQREVQEMAQRLLEATSAIAGSCLEQTTWLRKNFAVKPGPQSDTPETEEGNQHEDAVVSERRVADMEPQVTTATDSKYSVQALSLLAELTAPLLDVVYNSEEKDKVATFLTTLLYNVFPYLKNHSSQNLPSLRAASQFLASISSYQYTRKSWRREALDLLLDNSFFQMDVLCISYWLNIVDNLMTHDKTTYKDLMARVTMAQTGSLNLFSNKEQELDQKAGMLKRLAFTIFCSEPDQYQKSIPEIQEKLAESLRVLQAPSVMAQVFTCFRVLMLRISPQHLTSMWPTIITELIHVFLQIEQELSTETEEFVTQVQRIAALDSSWAHLGNGLNAHNNPSWLQLYLSACKLLDMCLALPADRVPQFQLYRWAFIGGAAAGEGDEELEEDDMDETPRGGTGRSGVTGKDGKGGGTGKKGKEKKRAQQSSFKPHIIRLARLLNTKLQGDVPVMKMTPGRPLLTISYLRSLAELQPFFNTLCLANQTDNILLAARQLSAAGGQSKPMSSGHAELKIGNQSESRLDINRGMPKSKSAPVFNQTQKLTAEIGGINVISNKQYLEEILKRDFLEPMP